MSDYVIAEGLGKIYDKDYAVKDINFKVKKGEIFGFIGPNGAGKTTTLRMMCGILDPTEGSINIGGQDTVDDKIEVKKLTGYLPEEDFLYGDMTVRDHLTYIAELFGVENIEKRLDKTLQAVDMTEKIDLVIKTLSKGQRRRVAIAKTLIHDPEIVLLDEVTSGLDPVYARRMVNVVDGLRKEKKTVVFSTHLLDEATTLCDHLLVINHGHLMALGDIKDVLKQTDTDNLQDAFFKLIDAEKD